MADSNLKKMLLRSDVGPASRKRKMKKAKKGNVFKHKQSMKVNQKRFSEDKLKDGGKA
jgi:hypothetical protein